MSEAERILGTIDKLLIVMADKYLIATTYNGPDEIEGRARQIILAMQRMIDDAPREQQKAYWRLCDEVEKRILAYLENHSKQSADTIHYSIKRGGYPAIGRNDVDNALKRLRTRKKVMIQDYYVRGWFTQALWSLRETDIPFKE